MKSVTVFCGASPGFDSIYKKEAEKLAQLLVEQGIQIVFGGGKIGMMGTVADAALDSGGKVTGVIPVFLKTKEVAHDSLTTMHVVKTMHERKMMMHELSDGVIALAGGYGTLEELFEMLTWAQLGLHEKPIALLNTKGYFNHLLQFLDRMNEEGFLNEINRKMILVHEDPEILLEMMRNYLAPDVPKWLNQEEV